MVISLREYWIKFGRTHSSVVEFLLFFLISNGVTLLQMLIMPVLKYAFGMSNLIDINFQVGLVGNEVGGDAYYIFNYAAGALSDGGGGGLAYFLAVQVTMAIAQIINFFVQRKVAFKSDCNILKAALWYMLAYVVITVGAAAAQGFYKEPIYRLFMTTLGMGKTGETISDIITMIINSVISFWVFFPILKVIFKQKASRKF